MPMEPLTIDEVWQKLHVLDGQVVPTLVKKRLNRIIGFTSEAMARETEIPGGRGWRDATPVSKADIRRIWSLLTKTGYYSGDGALAVACLVKVPELGVELDEGRTPRTIVLKNGQITSKIKTQMRTDDEDDQEFGDLDRIVVDPDICSGKPTIRGTRIMVSNILGMFAGDYSVNRILKSYPEISRLDVISAVEYASLVVDEEKMVGRS